MQRTTIIQLTYGDLEDAIAEASKRGWLEGKREAEASRELTTKEAAALKKVSVQTIRRAIQKGELKATPLTKTAYAIKMYDLWSYKPRP